MDKTKDIKLKVALSCACILLILCSVGCTGNEESKSTGEVFAMDTYMTFTAYGDGSDEAISEAEDKINELDKLLTSTQSTEDAQDILTVYELNQNAGGKLETDIDYLLGRALDIHKLTDGAFNPCMYVIMDAWGFTSKDYRVPEQSELEELLELTDVGNLNYDAKNQSLKINQEGTRLDLGGIAKGYTSAQIADIFKENGVESGLINLGGNVQAVGTKPDGSSWRVGIQSPDDSNENMGIIAVEDKAVITSGGYERYFEEDGRTYHHIIDPDTGYPVDNDIKSMTIVSEDGTLADALSTALFVMGREEAQQFWKQYGQEYGFEIIIISNDNKINVSEGLKDDFEPEEGYEVTVIQK